MYTHIQKLRYFEVLLKNVVIHVYLTRKHLSRYCIDAEFVFHLTGITLYFVDGAEILLYCCIIHGCSRSIWRSRQIFAVMFPTVLLSLMFIVPMFVMSIIMLFHFQLNRAKIQI